MAGEAWNDPKAVQLSKAEFDRLCDDDQFQLGPYLNSFGDGYGEPYNPNREAGGILKDGRVVWAWVRGPKAKEPTDG